ncbi:hypothetical protein BC936DRAFT_142874 [Jimgerdemannia flammicorona]|uniref:Uncharacterized protein n=1 Tax=Jimgerdemannia flammicorona TaxID=994334 RepID=A0A432ZZP6_9FUNG|nr:hypothetical protein BC936DRAFT_142874 [Jimgerdemannia flammicorona]
MLGAARAGKGGGNAYGVLAFALAQLAFGTTMVVEVGNLVPQRLVEVKEDK